MISGIAPIRLSLPTIKTPGEIATKHLIRRWVQPFWSGAMSGSQHVYEIRPRKDRRGVDLISDVLPFGALWYGEPNAINFAKFSVAHQPFPDP
jgi:hypothetical protein